jgi:hypothetical protein
VSERFGYTDGCRLYVVDASSSLRISPAVSGEFSTERFKAIADALRGLE